MGNVAQIYKKSWNRLYFTVPCENVFMSSTHEAMHWALRFKKNISQSTVVLVSVSD